MQIIHLYYQVEIDLEEVVNLSATNTDQNSESSEMSKEKHYNLSFYIICSHD